MTASRLHILLVPAWYPSATNTNGVFVKDQGEALVNAGHKVAVLVVNYFSFGAWFRKWLNGGFTAYDQSRLVSLIEVNCVFIRPLRFVKDKNRYMQETVAAKVLRRMKRYAAVAGTPDVLHHHCLSDNAFLTERLSRLWNRPYLLTEHSPYRTDAELNKFNPFETFADRERFVKNAALRIAVSGYWANFYEAIYNAPYTVIPNMVDRIFDGPVTAQKNEAFTFCCVAFLDKHKNQSGLLKAFAMKFKGRADVRLELVGNGPAENELKTLTEQEGISGQVIFHGKLPREKVVEVLDHSHVAVLASFAETFGIALVEAMFRGLPVVTTACGGPEEFVQPDNGLIAANRNTADLAEKLEQVFRNYKHYDPLQIAAAARGKFSGASLVKRLEEEYYSAKKSHLRFS